jgi:hypothetical protein
MLVWIEIESYACGGLLNLLYACGGLLNLLIHLMLILAHGFLLVILYWSPYMDSLLFCKS